jgi:hypothetical protein
MACPTPLDIKIRRASKRLNEVRAAGDDVLTEFWFNELDHLLEAKLDEITKVGVSQ